MQKSSASKNEMFVLASYALRHGMSTLHTALKASFALAIGGKWLSECAYRYGDRYDATVDHADQNNEENNLFLVLSSHCC